MKNKTVKKSEVVSNKGDAAQGGYSSVDQSKDESQRRHAETSKAKKVSKGGSKDAKP